MARSVHPAPDLSEIHAARTVIAQLPSGELWLAGVPTPLPEPVAVMLRDVLTHVAAGNAVSLVVREGEMSRIEAADSVEFSRVIATQLIEDGKIIRR